MQASHELSRVSVSFDEPNLVSRAGLVPVAELALRLRVGERIDDVVPGLVEVEVAVPRRSPARW